MEEKKQKAQLPFTERLPQKHSRPPSGRGRVGHNRNKGKFQGVQSSEHRMYSGSIPFSRTARGETRGFGESAATRRKTKCGCSPRGADLAPLLRARGMMDALEAPGVASTAHRCQRNSLRKRRR
ncbi:hypothetical protein KM043_002234 [Ampulex compressa]|nr:hypothetical protein KM043_002234 [Ampulex compressa]